MVRIAIDESTNGCLVVFPLSDLLSPVSSVEIEDFDSLNLEVSRLEKRKPLSVKTISAG